MRDSGDATHVSRHVNVLPTPIRGRDERVATHLAQQVLAEHNHLVCEVANAARVRGEVSGGQHGAKAASEGDGQWRAGQHARRARIVRSRDEDEL